MTESKHTAPVVPMSPETEETLKQLASLEGEIPKVQEVFFVHRILPMLTDTSGQVDITLWVDIAGSIQRPIDIVNDAGEVLFRVPSPISSYPTSTQRKALDGVGHLIADAKAHGEIHPAMGERKLRSGLSKLIPQQVIDFNTARQWNEIRVRYGYDPLPGFDTKETQAPQASVFTGEDDEL